MSESKMLQFDAYLAHDVYITIYMCDELSEGGEKQMVDLNC